MINATSLNVFYLAGLDDAAAEHRLALFSLTSLCYSVIVTVNGALTVAIIQEEKLHEPMYVFLCNLCVNSLYGTAAFYPKFLSDLWSNSRTISHAGCLLQVFVIYSYASTDLSILALMAYDRYVAICRPLEYHSVMTKQRVVLFLALSRLVPLLCVAVVMIQTSKLELCGSIIGKVYCDNWSILQLSCGSTTTNNIVGFVVILFYFGHSVFIACSYVELIKSAFKSKAVRRKFARTCGPHLVCLLNVTAALLFDLMYARYGSGSVSPGVRNFMAIQFLMVPPLVNPVVYGLNLTKVRSSILSCCTGNKQGTRTRR